MGKNKTKPFEEEEEKEDEEEEEEEISNEDSHLPQLPNQKNALGR